MTFLRLMARCPRCFHRPNIRVAPELAAKHNTHPPDQEVGSIKCHRCGKKYPLTARAYQEAVA